MKIDVTWYDPNGIEDGYRVYRGDGAPVDLNNLPAPVADLPADTMLYSDTSVTFGAEYYYLIEAYKGADSVYGDQIHAFAVPDQNVYVAVTQRIESIDVDGNQLWQFTPPSGIVNSVVNDVNGYSYLASDDNKVRKVDPSGIEVWNADLTASALNCVAIDDQGSVYVTSKTGALFKLDPNGNQLWSYGDESVGIGAMAVDYATGQSFIGFADGRIKSVSTDGVELWNVSKGSLSSGPPVTSIDVNDTMLVVGDANFAVTSLSKVDGSGSSYEWIYVGLTNDPNSISFTRTGNIVVGGKEGVVCYLDPNGNELDRITYAAAVHDARTDYKDNLFVCTEDGNRLIKLDENHTKQWEIAYGTVIPLQSSVESIQFNLNEPSYVSGANV